ncbi:5'-methylthioadenosine/adenosylhomocysteine nucleosidase [Glaciecola sp. XM2]|jgi:adenosylhomocysteine nucleosidase|uniref:5'-methylthioadenosine/adenosylhomocysteine nucleosidase n=1 Tax=Glaciecola sp. XM2 TaxID=1914931 RepID=UPI001BDDFD6C|nr:5'-methylthioadenosine/adenosylhomocysteine nucleosidase [Glaciecola sp. XM2]MBT1452498.1 5'-methylthioadenosine/adenosylhomocysteine nucleosidase [Glaciecola sp. XM2]
MKIAIIGAMEEEITLLKSHISNCQNSSISHLEVFHGSIFEHEIYLVQSGIGKVASALATSLLIHQFSPDLVINTGSAGGFDPDLNIGDIVIADALMYHDVDVRHFGYEYGQVPAMPKQYVADSHASAIAFSAANSLDNLQVKTGLICSGDSFIGSDEAAAKIREIFPQMKAVEMEGASIAQTCHMMDTPCVVIRSLSDIAGKTSTVSFEQYLEKAAKNSALLVHRTLEGL